MTRVCPSPRSLRLALAIACLGGAAFAGKVTIRSNRRIKVNLGGKKVLGVFPSEAPVVVSGLPSGTHKIYVKDVATGAYDMIFVSMPNQDGDTLQVDFPDADGSIDALPGVDPEPAPVYTPPPAAPMYTPPARSYTPPPMPVSRRPVESPPRLSNTGPWKKDMHRLFDLHEVSLETLEAMQSQLDKMKEAVAEQEARGLVTSARVNQAVERMTPADVDDPAGAAAAGGAQVYAFIDGEYSETNASADNGSFDAAHGYIGVTGPIHGNWSGRLEFELRGGFHSNATRTTGEARMARGYITHKGAHSTFKVGKMFTPFGFWSPNQQEIFNDTVQAPLQFETLYPGTSTGLYWTAGRHGNHFGMGVFNGEGPTPDSLDTNDDKSFILSWERKDFMDGRIGLAYNRQRDGNQNDRREESWLFSLEQKWRNVRMLSEYLAQDGSRTGGIGSNDSWYADFRYDFDKRNYGSVRWDWMRNANNAGMGSQRRTLVNYGHVFSPVMRFKADFYKDDFSNLNTRSQRGMDLQLAAAIGL